MKMSTWRKIKVFAVVGFVGLLFAGGVVVWAGISAVNYAVSSANQFLLSPESQRQIQTVVDDVKNMQLQPQSCWESAQRFLAVQPWLEKPVLDNINVLKTSCFKSGVNLPEGEVI